MEKCGIFRTYYTNNNILNMSNDTTVESEYFINNGVKDGDFKKFYITGELLSLSTYINNRLEGQWTTFRKNGKIKQKCNYVNNKIEGEFIEYYENENIREIYTFVAGQRNGKYTGFYENGNIRSTCIYNSDKFIDMIFYNLDGSIEKMLDRHECSLICNDPLHTLYWTN